MGTKGYTLCAVATGAAYNQMQATLFTASATNGLPDDYTAFCPLNGQSTVAAYASGSGQLDLYAVPAPGQGFGAPVGSQALETGYDILIPFTIGTQELALAYTSSSGIFQFFGVTGSGFQPLNTFSSTSPSTVSLTTVLPFFDWQGSTKGGSYMIGYDTNTGQVAFYQLTAQDDGTVAVNVVWQPTQLWDTGWMRFGYFQFGPESFFIKTNPSHGHVYIDHIMDDPSQGSHPAVTGLPLPLDLTATVTFTLQGDPCFATYFASSGAVTLNRFRGDLNGWFEGAQATVTNGGSMAVSLVNGSAPVILFY